MPTPTKSNAPTPGERIDRRGLAQQLAARTTGVTEAQMYTILGEFAEVVTENLQHGVTVNLAGFGTWKPTERAARMGRDIRTQQAIEIPARRAANFSAGANLKTALAGTMGGGAARARVSGSPTAQATTASATNTGKGRGGGRKG